MEKSDKIKKMALPSPRYEIVKKQYERWRNDYDKNDDEGRDGIAFGLIGDQWDPRVAADRIENNKEALTFNLCLKHTQKAKSQNKEVEFSLDLCPVNNDDQNIEETKALRMVLNHILLSRDALGTFSSVADKCLDYGYSVLEVNFEREDDKTLCKIPVFREVRDPSWAFFDKDSRLPTMVDGKFCGLRKDVSRNDVLLKLPNLADDQSFELDDAKNELISYWYRVYGEARYMCLEGGLYKREDLLTPDDIPLQVKNKRTGEPKFEMGQHCQIAFKQFLNEKTLSKPILFPTDDLPLIYNYGLTIWTPDQNFTFPLTFALKGAQKLHNYIQSQIATVAKNSTSDKWLGTDEHVKTQTHRLSAQNINKNEGFFIFGKDKDGIEIRRERAGELPQTMIEMGQIIKQEMDEIAGALIDKENAQQTVLSGKALDRITHNLELLHAPILAAQVDVVNTAGKLVGQMIPRIMTEQRTLVVKKGEGAAESITINKKLLSGTVVNNIKDLNNSFQYEIVAGPSTIMQQENTNKALEMAYGIDPQFARNTMDIYMRNLGSKDSGELSRRAAANIDPQLIRYGMGEISEEEFRAYQQKKEQDAMAAQQNTPENKSMLDIGQAEGIKAQAAMLRAQTERMKQTSEALDRQKELQLQMFELIQKAQGEDANRQVEIIKLELEKNKHIIDTLLSAEKKNAQQTAVY